MAMFHSYVSLPEGKPPFSYGFPIKTSIFLWFSYGFPMVFLWFSWLIGDELTHKQPGLAATIILRQGTTGDHQLGELSHHL